MIRSLKIQHFRSHRDVYLKNLSRINLLTGMNNTGKTVALEALFLLSLPAYPQIAINQLNRFKAKVHAFLATFVDPDKDLGKVTGVWQYSHHALAPVLELLQSM